MPKTFKIVQMWQNFAKSDHIGWIRWIYKMVFILFVSVNVCLILFYSNEGENVFLQAHQ